MDRVSQIPELTQARLTRARDAYAIAEQELEVAEDQERFAGHSKDRVASKRREAQQEFVAALQAAMIEVFGADAISLYREALKQEGINELPF